MNRILKLALVVLITLVLLASSYMMLFPTVLVIVPTAIVLGVVCAVRRSFWALVCLGYPLLFGLWSAWVGSAELEGYTGTFAFALSVAVGIMGLGMILVGLWRAFPHAQGGGSCAWDSPRKL